MDLTAYRNRESEKARVADLMTILPKKLQSALDIGARDGFISRLLTEHFQSVTALDLELPTFQADRVTPVQGDVTKLQFADGAFDVVVCAEVLEHLRPEDLPKACSELARVARHAVVIGVPFRQDTRVGRMTCSECGAKNPPWAHLNEFDEARLRQLFHPLAPASVTFIGEAGARTNALAAWLLDRGRNPWGTYNQQEPCVRCGARLVRPANRGLFERASAALGLRLQQLHGKLNGRGPMWIHVVFSRSVS